MWHIESSSVSTIEPSRPISLHQHRGFLAYKSTPSFSVRRQTASAEVPPNHLSISHAHVDSSRSLPLFPSILHLSIPPPFLITCPKKRIFFGITFLHSARLVPIISSTHWLVLVSIHEIHTIFDNSRSQMIKSYLIVMYNHLPILKEVMSVKKIWSAGRRIVRLLT